MSMLTHRFVSADQTALCADVYEPEQKSERLALVLHGYCEHRGRYRHVAKALAEAGYHVVAMDLRGHGESGGARAHVQRFGEYLEDVRAGLALAQRLFPGPQKPVLIGHSMGGLVALLYTLSAPASAAGLGALVLSSPFLGLKIQVPAWKVRLGQIASRVYPGLALPSELDPNTLTHEAAICQAYATDPMVSRIATARWFVEAQWAQAEVRRLAPTFQGDLPILLMHAGDDRIADPAASKEVFERLMRVRGAGAPGHTGTEGRKRQLVLYPGMYHEIFNEVEKDRVLADMTGWLRELM